MRRAADIRQDLYPSRCASTPVLLDRADPVIHGERGRRSPLTAAELESYERDGFIVLEPPFERLEIERLRAELERLRRDPAVRRSDAVIAEPGGTTLRSIFRVHELSPLLRRLTQDARLVRRAEYLLGGPVYLHQTRLNYKPGFFGKEFYWHSDFETWHVEDGMPRMRALSISVTLTENYALNGPLMVIPGSHRHFLSCVGRTPEDHYKTSLKKQAYGVPDDDSLRCLVEEGGIFMTTGKAGSVTVFDCNLMHGSNSNITPFPRSNAFFAYNAMSNTLAEPFGGTQRRPDFLSERQPVPLKLDRQAA